MCAGTQRRVSGSRACISCAYVGPTLTSMIHAGADRDLRGLAAPYRSCFRPSGPNRYEVTAAPAVPARTAHASRAFIRFCW